MHLGEVERSRAIFELAINQPILDMPEVLTLFQVMLTVLVLSNIHNIKLILSIRL